MFCLTTSRLLSNLYILGWARTDFWSSARWGPAQFEHFNASCCSLVGQMSVMCWPAHRAHRGMMLQCRVPWPNSWHRWRCVGPFLFPRYGSHLIITCWIVRTIFIFFSGQVPRLKCARYNLEWIVLMRLLISNVSMTSSWYTPRSSSSISWISISGSPRRSALNGRSCLAC